jgi:molybdenum cofactor cytidylyltransferase
MGGANKLLLPWGSSTVIEAVIAGLIECGIAEIVVSLGRDAEKIEQCLGNSPVRFVYNPHHREGMSTSIVQGVKHLPEGTDGIMIPLADMPAVRPSTLKGLCARFREHDGRSIVVPVYEERQGNPVIFPGSFRSELLLLDGDRGAKALLNRHAERVVRVPTDDPGVCMDIDTMQAYEEMTNDGMTNDEIPEDR